MRIFLGVMALASAMGSSASHPICQAMVHHSTKLKPPETPLSLSQFLISQGGIHGSNVDAEKMLTSSKQACHVTTMHAADSFCTPSLPMFVMQQNLCPLASSETRCGECMHLSV